ncbi:flippase-like domain-containing protein [candidate division KSB1 bacterium]|nr:flippase-like domain-containing protein [candidate division KSB1 bacterium]
MTHGKDKDGRYRALKNYAATVLKIGVSVILIYLLLRSIGFDRVRQQIAQASWYGVVLSLSFFIASNFLGALQWHILLRTKKIHLSFGQVLSYYHVGLFFNNFLIGYVGGDAVRVFDVRRSAGREKGALSTVFFDRFIGFFAMTTLALLAAAILAQRLISSAAILTIVGVFIVWVMAILFLFHKQFARKFSWIFKLLLPKNLHLKAKAFYESLDDYRRRKKLLLQLFLLSLLIQSLRILTHLGAARAIGVSVAWHYFFLFIPIVALAVSMPISIGGLGVREQSAVTLFSQIGVLSAQTVAFEFLAYLIGIIATVPGGIIFALRREHTYTSNIMKKDELCPK